jgi:hypothetical protein
MHTTRILRSTSAALAAAALAAPAAGAQPADLRMPDTREAASPVVSGQDLRGPDAIDAAAPVRTTRQDLRSPDAIDAAASPAPAPSDGDGAPWLPIAVVLAGGATAGVAYRRTRSRRVLSVR